MDMRQDKLHHVNNVKNIGKSQLFNMIFWALWYDIGFVFYSQYYVFDVSVTSWEFNMAMNASHIGIIVGLVISFIFFNKFIIKSKPYLVVLVAVLAVSSVIFQVLFINHVYRFILGLLIGIVGAATFLDFCYNYNNTERLYTLVFSHIFLGILALITFFILRNSFESSILCAVAYCICIPIAFLEKKNVVKAETKKVVLSIGLFTVPLLSCLDGAFGVGSAMLLMNKMPYFVADGSIVFYIFTVIGAVAIFLIYSYTKNPISIGLNISLSFTAIMIVFYLMTSISPIMWYFTAALAGFELSACFMTMYYVFAYIIKKYESVLFMKVSTVSINLVGGVIGVLFAYITKDASKNALTITLCCCFVVVISILAFSPKWSKIFSKNNDQIEYTFYDVLVKNYEIYKSYNLSKKESEIFEQLLTNKTIKQIAVEQFISADTVKTHRSNIYKKTGVNNREEFIKKFQNFNTVAVEKNE